MVSTIDDSRLFDAALSLPALQRAWDAVRKNKGKAGADGISIRQFARLRDANLIALADSVRNGSYRPGRIRRVVVRIGRKQRTLTILPVRDRVLQRSVLDALTPVIDPHFLSCSFGYRPGRSLHQAIERIVQLRDRGFHWVVDADIRDCFATLDHDLLQTFLHPLVPDVQLRSLIETWIVPTQRVAPVPSRGILLGAVISPLLCNVYLHQLDQSLRRRRYQLVRYADDFVILCKSQRHANRALNSTNKILRGLRLAIHPGKTRIATFNTGFTFLGVHFKRDSYSYHYQGKRVVLTETPPANFYYHPFEYE